MKDKSLNFDKELSFTFKLEEILDSDILILKFIKFVLEKYYEIMEKNDELKSYPPEFESYEKWKEYLENFIKMIEVDLENEEISEMVKREFLKIWEFLWL